MAKILIGVAMVAAGVALDVVTGGAATALEVAAINAGIGMGAGLVMSGIAQLLTPNQGTTVNSKNPVESWQVVYGRSRVSGPTISICETGSSNEFLYLIVPIAGHEIQSVDAMYLNGYQVHLDGTSPSPGGGGSAVNASYPDPNNPGQTYSFFHGDSARVYAEFYLGTTNQPASSFFIENGPPGYWNSNCTLNGSAYAFIILSWNTAAFPNGLPEIKFDVHGKNDILDPRTGTTGYSENPALCIADYLSNPLFGLPGCTLADFDSPSLIAAANACDEQQALAPGGTENLFTCNGCFKTSTTVGDNLSNMLACMGGNISYVQGKWKLYAAVWRGWSGTTLTEADFVGPITWKPNRQARELFNSVRGTFISPNFVNDIQYGPGYNPDDHPGEINQFAGEWMSTDIPIYMEDTLHGYSENLWYSQDGGYLYQDTHFPYVVSCRQAQQLAKILLERNRQQGEGTLTCALSALSIEPLDIIQVTYPRFQWLNKQLEVTATRLNLGSVSNDDGSIQPPSFELDVREIAPRVFEWSTTEELTIEGGTSPALPNMGSIVPTPTNVTLASGPAEVVTGADGIKRTQILVTWTPPASAFVTSGGTITIQIQPQGGATWTTVATVPGSDVQYYIGNVNDGANYMVQLCATNSKGATSEWIEVGPILANNTISTFNSSDVLDGQGSLLPTVNVPFTVSGTIPSGSTTENVTLSCAATTLALPSGRTISIPATSQTFSSLTFTTTYYWYPAWQINSSTVVFCGGACDGPSATAVQQQNSDGYIPLNLVSFTTGSTTSGGTGTGGNGNICPEADEPVDTLERGVLSVGDVEVGEHVLGMDLKTGETVYRKVIAKTTEYSTLWAFVDGHRISPFDEVWDGGWVQAHEVSGKPLVIVDGTRVKLTVDAPDHDCHNYFVGDLLIHNARIGTS